MPAYKIQPSEVHFTAAIKACEKSDQYNLAMSVFEEMKQGNIPRTTATYEALISVAEKTSHSQAAMDLLDEMKQENILGTTELYNSCMWAADKGGNFEYALNILKTMEQENIPRDASSYAACTWACESSGAGDVALHILDLMKEDSIEMNTPTYQAVIWACVKGGMWHEALEIFDRMEVEGLTRDVGCYNGAIWACEQGGLDKRAIELLKLIKFEGLKRDTMSFDGVLSTLQKSGDWEMCMEIYRWIERDIPAVTRSFVTYRVLIEVLDSAGQDDLAMEIYLAALREGGPYFDPWIKGTRVMDVRRFSPPVRKLAVKTVLTSMKQGKLSLFNLHIIVDDEDSEEGCFLPQDTNPGTNTAAAAAAADTGLSISSSYMCSTREYIIQFPPAETLSPKRLRIEGSMRLVLARDELQNWVDKACSVDAQDCQE